MLSLPDLWQLHRYDHEADLTVHGTGTRSAPGRGPLSLPGPLLTPLRPPPPGLRWNPRNVPMVQDAGPDLALLTTQLQQAPAAWPNTPARAAAEVWAALWRVSRSPLRGSGTHRPFIRRSQPPSPSSRRGWGTSDATGHPGGIRCFPQPPDAPLPRRDGGDGRRLHPGPEWNGRTIPADHHALRPRRRRVGRHSRPTGVQQGLSPLIRSLSARHPCLPCTPPPRPSRSRGADRVPRPVPGVNRRQPFRIRRQPSSAPRLESSNGRTCRLHGRPRCSAGAGTS